MAKVIKRAHRSNISIHDDLHAKLKGVCAKAGMLMTNFVERSIEKELARIENVDRTRSK